MDDVCGDQAEVKQPEIPSGSMKQHAGQFLRQQNGGAGDHNDFDRGRDGPVPVELESCRRGRVAPHEPKAQFMRSTARSQNFAGNFRAEGALTACAAARDLSIHFTAGEIKLRGAEQNEHGDSENAVAGESAEEGWPQEEKVLRQEVIFEIGVAEEINDDAEESEDSAAGDESAGVERAGADFARGGVAIFHAA